MRIMKSNRLFAVMALVLTTFTSSMAQEDADSILVRENKHVSKFQHWGACVDGSVLFSNGYDGTSMLGWGMQCIYRLNTNFSVGLGARLYYQPSYHTVWGDSNYHYEFDKETDDDGESTWRRQFDLVASASYILPVIRHGGVVLGGTAIVSPIPLEAYEVRRYPRFANGNTNYSVYNYESKSSYDAFQPGVFAETGIYYDIKEAGGSSRISLTYGVGAFDMFKGSRHATVFNQRLRDILPKQSLYHSLTLRVTAF